MEIFSTYKCKALTDETMLYLTREDFNKIRLLNPKVICIDAFDDIIGMFGLDLGKIPLSEKLAVKFVYSPEGLYMAARFVHVITKNPNIYDLGFVFDNRYNASYKSKLINTIHMWIDKCNEAGEIVLHI